MEFPVGLLEGLGNPGHRIHDIQAADQVRIDPGGVAHQADHRLIFSFGDMGPDPVALQPADQMVPFFLPGLLLQCDNQCLSLLRRFGFAPPQA